MTEMSPTNEQLDIVNLTESTSENILINALAGTGKTTTLELMQNHLPSAEKPTLCLAFNKSIALEMENRFPSTTQVRTFNSLGHRIWASAVGKVNLDAKKTQDILYSLINELKGDDRKAARDSYWEIIGGVSLAKSLGHVPDGKFPSAKRLISRESFHDALEEAPQPIVADLIDACLFLSIKAAYAGSIDFNDQIYMPALFGGSFPRFPHVMVDEAQDLNPTNHEMLHKLARDRLSVVGDRRQSIYGFRGAVTQGMEVLKQKFKMSEADLSISFRCPRAIVEAVHWHVPHFKWVKEGGHYAVLDRLNHRDIVDNNTIICRNNAPLFRMALLLLSHKKSVSVSGSDVGPRITKLLGKFGDHSMSRAMVVDKINEWREEKLLVSRSPGSINDMAECMKVFASFGETLGQAIGYAEHLFAQKGTIRLMTGHKSKGLEFDTVYHLDPWLINDDRGDQEKNLRYVISTRSKDKLFEIDSKDIKW